MKIDFIFKILLWLAGIHWALKKYFLEVSLILIEHLICYRCFALYH